MTYKTAWRIGQQIRILMETADGDGILRGHIEVDESYIGGHRPGKRGRGAAGKTIVAGMKQREGRIVAEVVPDTKMETLKEVVLRNVETGSTVSSDELKSYGLLTGAGYTHGHVKHGVREYARYDQRTGVTHHVNNVESFWRLFKNSIVSTHIHVSSKYMNRYLSEFTFRSNHRQRGNAMFDLLIAHL